MKNTYITKAQTEISIAVSPTTGDYVKTMTTAKGKKSTESGFSTFNHRKLGLDTVAYVKENRTALFTDTTEAVKYAKANEYDVTKNIIRTTSTGASKIVLEFTKKAPAKAKAVSRKARK